MKRFKLSQKLIKGYSLIEILLYMGLLGLFLFSLSNLFVSSLEVRLESEATSAVEQDARYLLSRLRYDILRADSIGLPAVVGSQNASLILSIGGTSYTYSVNNGDLVVSDGATSDQLNSSRTRVTAINFQRLGNPGGNNAITTTYTLESKTVRPSGPEIRNYQTTFAIR